MEFFRYMKKEGEASLNRKGRVAYTRRGSDYVETLGSGSNSRRKVATVWVTARNGQKYEIPVDRKTGKVPEEYLFAHFLNPYTGSRTGRPRSIAKDIGIDAEVIHELPEGGVTPQQLIEMGWWQGVNTCDIAGIDDFGATMFARELEEASRSAQGAGKKMVFLMPEDSAARARAILTKDFNASELNKAVRNGGIIIKEGNPGRGAAGCYVSKQEDYSLKTPVIILKKGDWNEETLVHEFTHHLRHVDETRGDLTRTPLKLNENGERISSLLYRPEEFNSAINLEEASTVAESLVRIQEPSSGANGYYASTKVHGDTPYQRYKHDRAVLVPDSPMRGRKAERQVKGKFEDTSISHLGHYRPGSNAIKYYQKRKAEGTLPVAKKRMRKLEPIPGGITPKGMVGAEASKNRRFTKARR